MSDNIKDFFTKPLTMGATNKIEKSNPLKATNRIAHNSVDATVDNVTNYVADLLDPAYEGLKSLLTMPLIFGKNGLKSLPKGFLNFFINELTAIKNMGLGIVGGASVAYKKGFQNSVVDATNGTTDRIPFIGHFLGNLAKLTPSTLGLIPDILSGMLEKVDKGFDKMNSYTRLEGRSLPKVRTRLLKEAKV